MSHSEAVRVVAEELRGWLPLHSIKDADLIARAAVEALYAATVEPDCPTCGGTGWTLESLQREIYEPESTAGPTSCLAGCNRGKLPSRYLVTVDAERDGKLESSWRKKPNDAPLFREVPPEEVPQEGKEVKS